MYPSWDTTPPPSSNTSFSSPAQVPLNYAAPEGQSALDMGLTDYKYGDDEGEEE